MTTETHVHRALERTRAEQDAIEAKIAAFETFSERVSDLAPERSRTAGTGVATASGLRRQVGSSSPDRCREVRTIFADTVRPHSVADVDDPEPLLATVRDEFTGSIATALAQGTDATFSAELKAQILSEAGTRTAELAVTRRALDREESSLEAAVDVVDETTDWIVAADETPLTDLGFEQLRDRHERLSAFRDECDALLQERQSLLGTTTSRKAEAGIRHRSLVEYLYEDFPVDYPVLSTVTRLDDTCGECQRAVRAHLARRG